MFKTGQGMCKGVSGWIKVAEVLVDAQRRVSVNIEKTLSIEALKSLEYVGRTEGQSHKQYSGMSFFLIALLEQRK